MDRAYPLLLKISRCEGYVNASFHPPVPLLVYHVCRARCLKGKLPPLDSLSVQRTQSAHDEIHKARMDVVKLRDEAQKVSRGLKNMFPDVNKYYMSKSLQDALTDLVADVDKA